MILKKKKKKIIIAAIVTIGWRGYCKHPGKIKITNWLNSGFVLKINLIEYETRLSSERKGDTTCLTCKTESLDFLLMR